MLRKFFLIRIKIYSNIYISYIEYISISYIYIYIYIYILDSISILKWMKRSLAAVHNHTLLGNHTNAVIHGRFASEEALKYT